GAVCARACRGIVLCTGAGARPMGSIPRIGPRRRGPGAPAAKWVYPVVVWAGDGAPGDVPAMHRRAVGPAQTAVGRNSAGGWIVEKTMGPLLACAICLPGCTVLHPVASARPRPTRNGPVLP